MDGLEDLLKESIARVCGIDASNLRSGTRLAAALLGDAFGVGQPRKASA
ncbi:MAG TPA: hypothetical protein VFP68_13495 [Burkholderiaceae bacterium]|nr:hypothetical protein [Burkholderiaceae bacterium]